jgi:hypothetical protein
MVAVGLNNEGGSKLCVSQTTAMRACRFDPRRFQTVRQ